MLKHKIDPISDMMVSNDGMTTAIARKISGTKMRMALRRSPRLQPERPASREGDATLLASRPKNLSIELTMGRELRFGLAGNHTGELLFETHLSGIFVIGMIAIKTTMTIEMALAYPTVMKMLEVISSRTFSPNIKYPTIAIIRSIMYCKCWFKINDLVGFSYSKAEGDN